MTTQRVISDSEGVRDPRAQRRYLLGHACRQTGRPLVGFIAVGLVLLAFRGPGTAQALTIPVYQTDYNSCVKQRLPEFDIGMPTAPKNTTWRGLAYTNRGCAPGNQLSYGARLLFALPGWRLSCKPPANKRGSYTCSWINVRADVFTTDDSLKDLIQQERETGAKVSSSSMRVPVAGAAPGAPETFPGRWLVSLDERKYFDGANNGDEAGLYIALGPNQDGKYGTKRNVTLHVTIDSWAQNCGGTCRSLLKSAIRQVARGLSLVTR